MYFLYPETSYRSLEEVDAIFIHTESWLDLRHAAERVPRRFNDRGEPLNRYADWLESSRTTASGSSVISSDGSMMPEKPVQNWTPAALPWENDGCGVPEARLESTVSSDGVRMSMPSSRIASDDGVGGSDSDSSRPRVFRGLSWQRMSKESV